MRVKKVIQKVNFKNNKKFKVITLIILVCLVTIVIGRSLAVLTPVKSIIITSQKSSFEEKAPGSWQVVKSAKWTSTGKARITFDLETVMKKSSDYSDIILALDISGSMEGEKLERVKSDTSSLVETILKNDQNKVALITFESTSEIVENLTNNKDKLIEDINNLQIAGGTNYYQAFQNIDNILKNYTKEENREVIVLFLTDGYPTEDSPNEIGEYTYLKAQYPYLIMNAVQYEMGGAVLEPIKAVSDQQYIADMKNLNNVLFEASVNPVKYSSFQITDYLNDEYFEIASIKNINTSIGNAILEYEEDTPKITWTIEKDTLKSGQSATMSIDVSLKEEYLNSGGIYPTNKKERITSSIINTPDEDIESTKTPIIADNYVVKYEGNAPAGCDISNVPEVEKRSVYSVVGLSTKKPVCGNYQFKGWEIITKDVTRVNNDYFIMPEEDVIIRAKWSNLSIRKNVDGEISQAQTLYGLVSEKGVMDNEKSEFVSSNTGVSFGAISSDTNGKGVYLLASTKDDEYPIYYYRGDVSDNNVKFGGFCWLIVRTTETGGVKLVYNGEPDSNGRCTGEVNSYVGTAKFNVESSLPAYSGYMYDGEEYSVSTKAMTNWYEVADKSLAIQYLFTGVPTANSDNYYYADNIRWDGEKYVLENSDGSEVTKTIWEGNYNNLKGKYRCKVGSDNSCSEVYYLAQTLNEGAYVISLTGGDNLASVNDNWNFSKNVRYENGKYILEEVISTIKREDWYNNYDAYSGYYYCSDGKTTCDNINYIIEAGESGMRYIEMNNGETVNSIYEEEQKTKWIYGNDVEWDGTSYKINKTNRVESSPVNWIVDREKIGKGNHYTCFSTSDTCNTIYYIYYTGIEDTAYYITLSGGEKIEDVLRKMQTNTKNSNIKTRIDTWYQNNMTDYTSYLEDTVWCNDRSMGNSNGWTKDGDASNHLSYGSSGRGIRVSLDCLNDNDSFTVSEENGNGMLTYPVGLLTADEVRMAGGAGGVMNKNFYLISNITWWLMSPGRFQEVRESVAYNFVLNNGGYVNVKGKTPTNYNARPAISLIGSIRVRDGDGTGEYPYILED